jgi:hypothetical protein
MFEFACLALMIGHAHASLLGADTKLMLRPASRSKQQMHWHGRGNVIILMRRSPRGSRLSLSRAADWCNRVRRR